MGNYLNSKGIGYDKNRQKRNFKISRKQHNRQRPIKRHKRPYRRKY